MEIFRVNFRSFTILLPFHVDNTQSITSTTGLGSICLFKWCEHTQEYFSYTTTASILVGGNRAVSEVNPKPHARCYRTLERKPARTRLELTANALARDSWVTACTCTLSDWTTGSPPPQIGFKQCLLEHFTSMIEVFFQWLEESGLLVVLL